MGGAQYQIKCLMESLLSNPKFEVTFIGRRVPDAISHPGYNLEKIGRNPKMPRLGYISDVLLLYRALKKIDPDVIYQRVGCGYTGIAALYARNNKIPMVWHVAHDNDVMRKSLRDKSDRNFVRRKLEKRSIEFGIKHAAGIVTQTKMQADLLKSNYSRNSLATIPNFHPRSTDMLDKSGPLTVMWVANFKRWKRPEVFVRLARMLRGLEGVRFVMVGAQAGGSGDREWNAEVLRGIRETRNIEYLGKLDQDKVNELFAKAHLFVNTSTFEGFANTFIQAWMREVPVISLSVDPDGVLESERIGMLAHTEERLADIVRELMVDPAKRIEYGIRARKYAESSHSSGNADCLLELLWDIRPAR